MLKKAVVMILALVFALSIVMAGCQPQTQTPDTEAPAVEKPAAQEPDAQEPDAPAPAAGEKLYLGMAIRSLTNPYYIQLQEGGQMFADWLKSQGQDCEVVMLVSDGSDEKQLTVVRDFIASYAPNCIVTVDPNNAPNAVPIAEYCEENKVYWSTTWSTADELKIKDYEYYVFHQTLDDNGSGYNISKAMFESFDTPGEGKVLAIQGMLANSAAINRFEGLKKALAEYPGVELLEDLPADWDPQQAYTIAETWLAKYSDIDGIWCANDSMALSVVELLEAKDLIGKIKVVGVDGIDGAVQAIKAGKMTASVFSDPYKQGGMGLAYLYQAWAGNIVPSELPLDQRSFLTSGVLVTADTVDEFLASTPSFDFTDISSMIYAPWDIPLIQD